MGTASSAACVRAGTVARLFEAGEMGVGNVEVSPFGNGKSAWVVVTRNDYSTWFGLVCAQPTAAGAD